MLIEVKAVDTDNSLLINTDHITSIENVDHFKTRVTLINGHAFYVAENYWDLTNRIFFHQVELTKEVRE